jgi:hypothetical protein
MSEEWSQQKKCELGLVTGATDIPALKRIRELAPSAWFLCPGVGAQGGTAEVLYHLFAIVLSPPLERLPGGLTKGWEWTSHISFQRNFRSKGSC